jgi:hypothetical protein
MKAPARTLNAVSAALAVLSLGIPAAAARGEPKNVAPFAAPGIHHPTAVDRIIAQEDARPRDPAIFGTGLPEPTVVRVVQEPDGFDWGDAGVGGAAALALVLLVAGGSALRHTSRRQEAHG